MTVLTYTDLQIRIRGFDAQKKGYPVEADLGDGSSFEGGQLTLDPQSLLALKLDAQSYGLALFNGLFVAGGPIRTAYDQAMGKARANSQDQLRVRLRIDNAAAELQAIPWERMFHIVGSQLVPLSTSVQTPFSRYSSLQISAPAPIADRPIKMLFMVSNPAKLPPGFAEVDVEAEVANLQAAITPLRQSGHVALTVLPGRTGISASLRADLERDGHQVLDGPTSLTTLLRQLDECHILHFLGHGVFRRQGERGPGEAALYLEKDDGSMDIVRDSELVPKIAATGTLPHLIFLAACESATTNSGPPPGLPHNGGGKSSPFVGLGPRLIEAGVPAVVAMQEKVSMSLARQLTADFYANLLEHGVVDKALNQARLLLFDAGDIDWAIPVLFSRLQNNQLFTQLDDWPGKAFERLDFEPEMVFVAEGAFRMGSDSDDDEEKPQHEVDLADYWIGKYPITNREYAEFLERKRPLHPAPQRAGWFMNQPPAGKDDHPVVGVSWEDAHAYCTWLSEQTGRTYRLPSEAEWEKAARGVDARRYPWGSEWQDDFANVESSTTAPVQTHEAGASPYQCEDLLGNVEEWTNTIWGSNTATNDFPYPYSDRDRRNVDKPEEYGNNVFRIHRGDSYKSGPADVRCSARGKSHQGSKVRWRGFRVAMGAKKTKQ